MDEQTFGYDEQAERPGKGNVLGVVGFVLSLCLSPIGLVLSLVALKNEPRGFAIAGTIIGAIGTLAWVGCGGFLYTSWPQMKITGEINADYMQINDEISTIARRDGAVPDSLDGLTLDQQALLDPWGNAYRYEPSADGQDFNLTTAGPDGQFDTGDDATFHRDMGFMDMARAQEDLAESLR